MDHYNFRVEKAYFGVLFFNLQLPYFYSQRAKTWVPLQAYIEPDRNMLEGPMYLSHLKKYRLENKLNEKSSFPHSSPSFRKNLI